MIGPIFLLAVLALALRQVLLGGPPVEKKIVAKLVITKAGDVYTMKVKANGAASVLQVEAFGQDAFVGTVKEGLTAWVKHKVLENPK